MAESGNRNNEITLSRREPLLVPPEGAPSATAEPPSWRLNVKDFELPRPGDDKQRTSAFHGLLRKPRKQRKIADYYKKQERLLEGFGEMETMAEGGGFPGSLSEDELKQQAKSERMAIHLSNVANIVLFLSKVFAYWESKSLVVIASALDSLLDLLSRSILWFTSHAMKTPNQYHYPIGKKRMQPVVRFPSDAAGRLI